ncbi:protein STPG3 isoform X4 [Heterocephalus glaber]|uniref:Protein STPG3 isoform X4 n=1 Tax=Heterocephalus glaber TaxID=10181 RepID=A0AAX6T9S1_HETGA|nr:protein STPG3 isoform X4 [Heterocephalus glaber]
MNFDQKAVKFLANFYINGGKHWTHGPLRQKRPEAALLSWDADEKSPTSPKRTPMGWRSFVGSTGECPLTRTRTLRGLLLEQRPPLLADPDVPGPAEYAPRAFLREICPHLHYSIGCRHPGPDSGGRRAWHSAWLQSESPFTRKVDFNLERQGPPRVPGEQRPGPTAYDVRAGCRLQRPRPPAFSRSGSPAFAAGLRASCTPGPAAYHVEDCYDSRFPSAPGVVIQGVRRPKRHDTGPFCAL